MSTRDRIQPTSRRGVRAWLIATGGLALLAATTAPSLSEAALPLGPRAVKAPLNLAPAITPRAFFDAREDLKAAYNKALGQYNNLELDPAKAGLESALSGAVADDPLTAPLRMLKAVIIFSNTGKADETTAAFTDAVKADYNVSLPTELRSPDLQKLLDKARKNSGASAPTEGAQHTPPDLADVCGKDIKFTVRARQVPEGGQIAFYWRPVGGGEFKTATMDLFGNLGAFGFLTTAKTWNGTIHYTTEASSGEAGCASAVSPTGADLDGGGARAAVAQPLQCLHQPRRQRVQPARRTGRHSGLHAQRREAARVQQIAQRARLRRRHQCDRLQQELGVAAVAPLEVLGPADRADARHAFAQRDHPDPAVLELVDADVAGVVAGAALDAREVREQRGALVFRVLLLEFEPVGQERVAAGGIDQLLRAPLPFAIRDRKSVV